MTDSSTATIVAHSKTVRAFFAAMVFISIPTDWSGVAVAQKAAKDPDEIVTYKSVDGVRLDLHVFNPPHHKPSDHRPAIVFFFGGGWNGGKISQFYPQSRHLASRGMVAICANYRVKSRNKTSPADCVKDGKSAIRWVRSNAARLGVDPDRIAAGGGSAGGHVAAATALSQGFEESSDDTLVSCQPNALVLFNPVIDNGPDGFGFDRVKDYWKEFSPLHNIREKAPPTIIFLGTNDSLIPVSTVEEYAKRMKAVGARCELRLYEGAKHGFFNQSKKNSKYRETLFETDKFLGSLKYLDGPPPIELAQADTPVANDSKMDWWREARFGMFIHWGVYSVVGGEYKGQKLPNSAEWMMNRGKIPIAEYEQYAAQFNPVGFDADSFVGLAKKAGMKYMVITAKHHDGFAMFGSKASKFNVVDATPFKRDIIRELSEACQKQNIRLGFYYSQAQDWHHPGGMGNNWDKSLKKVSNDEYVQKKAYPEAKQLLTEYGPISIFWWDTPRKMSKESLDTLYSTRNLQPGLITNDRLGKGYPGDHKTFERTIPPSGPAGGEDWEVCMPISGSWGYKKGDDKFKSVPTLIRNLADIASKGGNYLLNVSPTGNGTLLPPAVERLEAIGKWMEMNSESIYDTSASPFAKLDWGRCTKKSTATETTLYLHVFDWPENGEITLPGLKSEVKESYLLVDRKAVQSRKTDDGVVVSLPATAPDSIDTVVVVKTTSPIQIDKAPTSPSSDGTLVFSAEEAFLHNNEGSNDVRVQGSDPKNIGYWTDAHAWVEWPVKITKPGKYEVTADLSVESPSTQFNVEFAGQVLPVKVSSTGGYGSYKTTSLGTIVAEKIGDYTIKIQPDVENWQPVNIRQVTLTPETSTP